LPRFDELFQGYNDARRAGDRLRTLTPVTPAGPGRVRRNGRELVLSSHPLLIERAAA
jgi:hypothetical protein